MATRAKKPPQKKSPASQAGEPAVTFDEAVRYSDLIYPLVAIGASAGGLDPFLEILRNLGDSPGMAVIVVIHQEKHASVLVEVVSRATRMNVETSVS